MIHKKWKPSPHEAFTGLQILSYMKFRAGEWVTKDDLENQFHMNKRTIRNLMHWLADEREEPVLALSNRKGYLYATNEQIALMQHARNERISRAIEILDGNRGIDKELRNLGVPIDEVRICFGNVKL